MKIDPHQAEPREVDNLSDEFVVRDCGRQLTHRSTMIEADRNPDRVLAARQLTKLVGPGNHNSARSEIIASGLQLRIAGGIRRDQGNRRTGVVPVEVGGHLSPVGFQVGTIHVVPQHDAGKTAPRHRGRDGQGPGQLSEASGHQKQVGRPDEQCVTCRSEDRVCNTGISVQNQRRNQQPDQKGNRWGWLVQNEPNLSTYSPLDRAQTIRDQQQQTNKTAKLPPMNPIGIPSKYRSGSKPLVDSGAWSRYWPTHGATASTTAR